MRRKKPSKAWADRLCSAAAILRDGHCVTCGKINETLQPGHFFGRTRQRLRWEMLNIGCQCASCNAIHENNPLPLERWIRKAVGEPVFEVLERQSGQPYPQPNMSLHIEELQHFILTLTRFGRLSDRMQEKVLWGDFTNRELIEAIR